MRTWIFLIVAILVGVYAYVHFQDKPVPPNAYEVVESFEFKGAERTRTIRKLKCGSIEMEFVKIPKGSFMMGSNQRLDDNALDNESPAHKVSFTDELWVAKYPVMKGQFEEFVKAVNFKTEAEQDGVGGRGFDGENLGGRKENYCWKDWGHPNESNGHPVVNVTWNDSVAFCAWMNQENNLRNCFEKRGTKWELASSNKLQGVRLLSEAEYEYANRGGETTVYFSGNNIESLEGFANIADKSGDKLGKFKEKGFEIAPFDDGEIFTSPVGKYRPNGFGLYDMTGNVRSWCLDWFDARLYRRGNVTDVGANQIGEQKNRVNRGSSWLDFPKYCRSAYRGQNGPESANFSCGFRVCMTSD